MEGQHSHPPRLGDQSSPLCKVAGQEFQTDAQVSHAGGGQGKCPGARELRPVGEAARGGLQGRPPNLPGGGRRLLHPPPSHPALPQGPMAFAELGGGWLGTPSLQGKSWSPGAGLGSLQVGQVLWEWEGRDSEGCRPRGGLWGALPP